MVTLAVFSHLSSSPDFSGQNRKSWGIRGCFLGYVYPETEEWFYGLATPRYRCLPCLLSLLRGILGTTNRETLCLRGLPGAEHTISMDTDHAYGRKSIVMRCVCLPCLVSLLEFRQPTIRKIWCLPFLLSLPK